MFILIHNPWHLVSSAFSYGICSKPFLRLLVLNVNTELYVVGVTNYQAVPTRPIIHEVDSGTTPSVLLQLTRRGPPGHPQLAMLLVI